MSGKCRQQLKDVWSRSSGLVPRGWFHFRNAEQCLPLFTQSVKDSQAPGAGTWSPVEWPNLGSSNCHIHTSGGTAQLLRQPSPACCSSRASSAESLSLHLSPKWPSESYFRHCLLASQAETVPFECSSTFGTFFYMFSTSVGTYSTVFLQC